MQRLFLKGCRIKVGNGTEDGVQQGPLINERGLAKVEQHLEDGEAGIIGDIDAETPGKPVGMATVRSIVDMRRLEHDAVEPLVPPKIQLHPRGDGRRCLHLAKLRAELRGGLAGGQRAERGEFRPLPRQVGARCVQIGAEPVEDVGAGARYGDDCRHDGHDSPRSDIRCWRRR